MAIGRAIVLRATATCVRAVWIGENGIARSAMSVGVDLVFHVRGVVDWDKVNE